MSDPDDFDLIERYLLGKMTDAERRAFEERLDDDRELARKLRLIRTFPEMMSGPGRIEYEKNRAEAAAGPVKKREPFRFSRRRFLVWAAVAFILILVAALFSVFRGTAPGNKIGGQEEKIVIRSDSVKATVAPVKADPGVPPPQQPEKKEIGDESGNAGQPPVSLLTPADGMKFSRKEMILFSWNQKTDSLTRFYILSENNDQVVFWRGIRPGIREYKVPCSYLLPGKFYWYVGSKEVRRAFVVSE
ncbi:MAG: hypothetical protein NTW10_03465 [Bacteroidetes bacterium]|nr:hypothetical protein [Bacteroidota bacterium]